MYFLKSTTQTLRFLEHGCWRHKTKITKYNFNNSPIYAASAILKGGKPDCRIISVKNIRGTKNIHKLTLFFHGDRQELSKTKW